MTLRRRSSLSRFIVSLSARAAHPALIPVRRLDAEINTGYQQEELDPDGGPFLFAQGSGQITEDHFLLSLGAFNA